MAKHKKLKKTLSKSDREDRKQQRNNRLVAIVMALLMVAGLAGIMLGGNGSNSAGSEFTYQDYSFKLEPIKDSMQSVLKTEVNGKDISFYTLPQDALEINVEGNLSFLRSTQYFILTGNPNDALMNIQDIIRFDISQATEKIGIGAVMFPSENYTLYPTLTCLNATTGVPVIELVESNVTTVLVDGSCVKIESQRQDVLRIRDLLLYYMVGILK